MRTADLFMDFLLPVPPQNVALILEVNRQMQHNHYEIHYRILYTVTLYGIVVLCGCMMKRDSHGYYRKMNWWHLTDLKNLKNQEKDLVAGKISYQCHHGPGAQSIVI